MLSEIKARDLLRTLILSAIGFGFFCLYFYLSGSLNTTTVQIMLGVAFLAAIFDTCWLNAKRKRRGSLSLGKPRSLADDREKQRKLTLKVIVGTAVAVFAIQFLINIWPLLRQ